MTPDERTAAVLEQVLGLPLHRALGIALVDDGDPVAGVQVTVGPGIVNPTGVLHGGLVPLLLDVAGFLALLPQLPLDRHAVTVSTASSIIAAARTGDVVRVEAVVDRLGRTQAFLSGRLLVGEKLVATGQVVKAVVAV